MPGIPALARLRQENHGVHRQTPSQKPKRKEKKRSEKKRKKRKLTFLTAKPISRVILKQRLFMVKF